MLMRQNASTICKETLQYPGPKAKYYRNGLMLKSKNYLILIDHNTKSSDLYDKIKNTQEYIHILKDTWLYLIMWSLA